MLVCISLYDVSFLHSQCLTFLVEFFLLLCGRCWHAWVKFLCILWKFTFVTFVKNFLYGNENFSLYFTCVHSFVTCPLLWLKYHIKYTKNWKSIGTVREIIFIFIILIFFILSISLNYQHCIERKFYFTKHCSNFNMNYFTYARHFSLCFLSWDLKNIEVSLIW